MSKVALGPEDPTIFAKCPNCTKTGIGVKVGDYFSKAFTARRWKKSPACDNCNTTLVKIYEVEIDD
jgi:hypothetical protein